MLFVSGMEVDSASDLETLSPQDRILLRLTQCGVPKEQLEQLQPGLVAFVKQNKAKLSDIVNAILPTEEDVAEASAEAKQDPEEDSSDSGLEDQFCESILWLRWLMFEDDPDACLKNLAKMSVGQRGVCGAVWGHNDIAYRCKTCEHDPTCAICVSCFQNGNHKDHDYSLMYTGGGCCDCGDETAWKREGFCSKHKGAEQIQPLPEEIACSVGPVLDVLLAYWEEKLLLAQAAHQGNLLNGDLSDEHVKVENELTSAVVEMLLEFCKHSESLLSFVSRRMFLLDHLLDVLVRAERFLNEEVTKRLHELLLKLLGDPVFKYKFAKIFIMYYPDTIKEAIKESSDVVLDKYRLVPTFSVQIFTVPTLTPRLVKEMNLLGILFGCLEDMFHSCAGEEGYLQVSKWGSLFETTIRLVEDTRYILSHVEVAKFVIHEQPDIFKTWMRLLAFVQGMNPQKRVTGLHVEEENERMHYSFVLGHSIASIHTLLVNEAFSVEEMKDDSNLQDLDGSDSPLRHTKVGRLSLESSVCSTAGRSTTLVGASQVAEETFGNVNGVSLPSAVAWLTCECLRAIENWLGYNAVSMDPQNSLSQDFSSRAVGNFLALKKTLSRIRKAKSISKVYRSPSARGRFDTSSDLYGRRGSLPFSSGFGVSGNQDYSLVAASDMDDPERASSAGGCSDSIVERECSTESEALGVLSMSDWPEIVYDVSSQEISVHIPLHRLLSVLLHKALKKCCGENGALEMTSHNSVCSPLSGHFHDFFGQVLRGCHPVGFSAFVMEHPLRIKVFCAEVRAGMWRKNGDVAVLSSEWYRSVRWEKGLELDIFLLQCCAALAPPEPFVKRILERFGLTNYLSLNLQQSNEYEPVLVQEMLTLIIQIVKERRLCGLSKAESLRRELIYKLAIGDATRSQLVKSLPQDLSKNDQLQMILDSVADYSNPSGMKQGKYSLRKTCWEEMDLYHPRWNSRDLQAAEERYLRFCKVSALAVQLPRWMEVFYPLNGISRIATSRALLEIVRAVFFYAVFTDKPSQSRAPEGVVIIALHLLSLGLDICSRHRQTIEQSSNKKSSYDLDGDSIPLLAFATEEISVGATNRSDAGKHNSLVSLLVSLMRIHKKGNFEAGQCNLSSLVANLLKKFAELNAGCMVELQRLAPEVVSHLMRPTPNTDVSTSAPVSDADERKLKAKERQAAIMEKMRAAQSKFMESLKSEENDEADVSKSKQLNSDSSSHVSEEPVVCSLCRDPDSKSPLSFLILLQKSRLLSFVERGPLSWEQAYTLDKEHSSSTTDELADPFEKNILSSNSETISASHLVQLVQNAVNDFSHNGLPGEVDAILDFIKTQLPVARNVQRPSTSHDTSMDTSSSIEMMELDIYQSIQKDMQDNLEHSNVIGGDQKFSTEHDEEGISKTRYAESTLLGKYIASLSRETTEHPKNSRTEHASSKSSVRFPAFDGFGPTDCNGIHISSCGHAVHQECRNRYLSSLRERYIRRIIFEGGHVVDPDQGEFLCPVCRRLANSVLPALPNCSSKVGKQMMLSDFSPVTTVGSSITSGTNAFRLAQSLTLLQRAGNIVGESGMRRALSLHGGKKMQPTLEPVFNILSRMYFLDRHEKFLASGRVSHSMVLWDTLKYSLISTEIAARGGRSNMCTGSSSSGLEALYKELESSSGFILSLLLQVVQNTRSENSLQVLLRFRGIQLFAESICSGVSTDEVSADTGYLKGNISSVLKHVDKGVEYPDIQFWRRAADPVLAHDPFSSLMWILFSLPSPFISSVECFLCLVHLFYAVSVIQAFITYIGKYQFDITELGYGDCLISDLCKIVGECAFTQQYFVSNHIDDTSCHPKDTIRRLSYPYLRRCALLWKLLRSSTPTPFSDRSHERIRISSKLNNDILECPTALPVELKEVGELEHMFQIPDVDVIVKDKILRSLGLKWFNHFSREYKTRNYGRSLHITLAIPFRLIHLPHVYQDLLERYIKKKCPECGAVQDEPALCLLCGRICSPSWKSCCRESGCQTHAMSCGAGIGVYLLIRRTTILLQRSARQAPWLSPYLDAFGEEDTEMRRGKPLYLNEERYAALTNMVASHGLDRSSEVLRQTTIDALFVI